MARPQTAPMSDAEKTAIAAGAILAAGFLLYVVWYQGHTVLSAISLKVALVSLDIMTPIYRGMAAIGIPEGIINLLFPSEVYNNADNLRAAILSKSPASMSFDAFAAHMKFAAYALRLLLLPVAVYCLFWINKRTKTAMMRRQFDIFKLGDYLIRYVPEIAPALRAKLLQQDPDKGPFRREVSPIRFALIHELLTAHKIDRFGERIGGTFVPTFDKNSAKKQGYRLIDDNLETGISPLHGTLELDIEKTHGVFKRQLGSRWRSFDELSEPVQALCGAFLCFAAGDKNTGIEALQQINSSWKMEDGKNYSCQTELGKKLLEKYRNNPLFTEITSSHAYTYTVLVALYQATSQVGKIKSKYFFWLKAVDRTLWYALNQEGGQCAWSEAGGVRSHFLAEVFAKVPITAPYVDSAVEAFEQYLRNDEGWLLDDKPEQAPATA